MLTHSHSDGEFPIYSQGEIRSGLMLGLNLIVHNHTDEEIVFCVLHKIHVIDI